MQRGTGKPVVAVMAVVTVALAFAGFLGCTPEARYRTLSFFFDGVPPPGGPPRPAGSATPTPSVESAEPEGTLPSTGSAHRPFADNDCAACHDLRAAMALSAPIDRLCARCHRTSHRQFPYVHGPIAVAACSFCHLPHSSPNAHLLGHLDNNGKVQTELGSSLCFRCHRNKDVVRADHPQPADRPCLDCHQPHGGDDPFFLRPPRTSDAGQKGG